MGWHSILISTYIVLTSHNPPCKCSGGGSQKLTICPHSTKIQHFYVLERVLFSCDSHFEWVLGRSEMASYSYLCETHIIHTHQHIIYLFSVGLDEKKISLQDITSSTFSCGATCIDGRGHNITGVIFAESSTWYNALSILFLVWGKDPCISNIHEQWRHQDFFHSNTILPR